MRIGLFKALFVLLFITAGGLMKSLVQPFAHLLNRIQATLALSFLLVLSNHANAEFATGGAGLHKSQIFWVDFGNNGENIAAGKTITRGFNVDSPPAPSNRLDITCAISNVISTRGSNGLFVYTSGNWVGDGFDDLYNIGGAQTGTTGAPNPNTLSAGIATPINSTAEFDFSCSATLGGANFPLSGLVLADAESSGSSEYVGARLTAGTSLRVIDSISNCGKPANISIVGSNEYHFVNPLGNCESSPDAQRAAPGLVGFIEYSAAARVGNSLTGRIIVLGGGISAVALGSFLALDFSEAIPNSYGIASHIMQPTWTGGLATAGVNYAQKGNLASLNYSGPRLGSRVDADVDANGAIGTTDVDALPKTTGPLGSGYANVAPPSARGSNYNISASCTGPGFVAGWIDFNGNGTFDASEKSTVVACPAGLNNVTLSWLVPLGSNYVAQSTSYMRLRTAPSSASIALPTGPSDGGEAEDYRLTLPPLQADMAIAATGFDPSPLAGSAVTGTVTCTNNGPDPATSPTCVVPTASLPPGATVSCLPSPTPNPLASGSAISCTVSYTAPASGTITIPVSTSSTVTDPVPSNNTTTITQNIVPQADVKASTNVPASVTAGQTVTVTGTCTNAGPSSAATPTCELSGLPTGATQTCSPSPIPNPLSSGSSITCSSTFTAPGNGPLSITTSTTTTTADPDASNNTSTQAVTVVPSADMVATVSGFPSNPPSGSTVNGQVVCKNLGPSEAANPSCNVTTLPTGATIACTPAPAPATLPVGQAITCTVSYSVPPSGGVTVTATASSTTNDPIASNNTAQVSSQVTPQADMQTGLTVPATVDAGQSVTVSGTCTNAGPSSAQAPSCTLQGLPAGATQTCTPAPVPDPLAVNAVITCTSTFIAPSAGPLSIAVTSGAATADPNAGNNTTAKPIAITPVADMAVSLSGFSSNVLAGSTQTGTLTCVNNGPSVATNATCSAAGLPPGASVSCNPTSPTTQLLAGAQMVCSVSYTAPTSGGLTVVGNTSSSTKDSNTSNNSASAAVSVTPQADMTAQTTAPSSAVAGQTITVSGVCSNAGPSSAAAPNCQLTGLPAGATQSCLPSPTPTTLDSGQSISCTSTFVAPANINSLTITTTASTSTADPVTSNNTDAKTVSLQQLSDMSVTMSGFPSTANSGDEVTGTLTCTNNGPSTASNPVCSVTLLPAGGLITCNPNPQPNPLAVGASITCNVSYIAPSNAAPLTVTGVTSSAWPDPNTSNNTDQRSINVVPLVDMVATISAPSIVNAGSSITVSGVCTNNGPSTATAPTCTILGLPAGTPQTCVPTPIPDPLAINATVTCSATFNAPASGPLNLTVVAGSTTFDSAPSNNSASQVVNVTPQADLDAVFSGFPTSSGSGSTVQGQLTCTNHGPSIANNAQCQVSGLPAGATVVCTPSSPVSNLAVGDSMTCYVNFTTPADGSPVNLVGSTTSSTADPVATNNSTSTNLLVVPKADMQATLLNLPSNPPAGSSVTGQAVCTNQGPSDAASPTCQLTGLPTGATLSCSPNPTPSVLAVGASITCDIGFVTPASGHVDVVATAGTATSDPVAGNNTTVQTVTTSPLADMQAQLSGFPSNVSAGQTVTGTLTCTNAGPSDAAYPNCSISGAPLNATIVCNPNPAPNALAVGASMTCSISYVATAGGAVTLIGIAGSTTADPVATNDRASLSTGVIDAVDDSNTSPISGISGGLAIPNVLSNDTFNGTAVTVADVTLTVLTSTSPSVTLNTATGAVSVAAGTPAGIYTVNYQICTPSTPVSCDTAVATVSVDRAPIEAVDDAVFYVGPAGGSTPVLGNDRINGAAVDPAAVNVSLVSSGGLSGVSLDSNGNLILPANIPPGSYTITYRICEKLNPTNCDDAVVPVVVQGVISGSVWYDNGGTGAGNQKRDAGEPGLSGWTAEVVYPTGHPQAGQVVNSLSGAPAMATTDSNGAYVINGLPPGDYQLRFRAPASAGQTGAVMGTPVNGEQGNPQTGSTVNPSERVLDIKITAGSGLTQQSLPLDPSGIVYDSISRQPITGSVVTLLGPDGQPVPSNYLLPNQQNQTVISSGVAAGTYRFDLLPTAPAGVYTIAIQAPTGYKTDSSLIPSSGTLPFQAGPGVYQVVPNTQAPQGSDPTTHYLQLTLNPGANGADVVHNHIPLDPTVIPSLIIEKRASASTAEIGDVVRYNIRVRTLTPNVSLNNIKVVDTLPFGFKYVPHTARSAGSPATVLAEPEGSPGPQLTFNAGTLSSNQMIEFSYYVKLGVGATQGDGINKAYAQSGALRSSVAQAKVGVQGGVFTTEACFIGKVYMDCGNSVGEGNGNAVQDPNELGIPGVRLYLENGTSITSDSEGKYSFCGVLPRTHVLKVDATTLPIGSRLGVTSNRNAGDPSSLFLDLKNGETAQADFREMSCTPAVLEEVQNRRQQLKRQTRQGQDVNAPQIKGQGASGPGLGLTSEQRGVQP